MVRVKTIDDRMYTHVQHEPTSYPDHLLSTVSPLFQ